MPTHIKEIEPANTTLPQDRDPVGETVLNLVPQLLAIGQDGNRDNFACTCDLIVELVQSAPATGDFVHAVVRQTTYSLLHPLIKHGDSDRVALLHEHLNILHARLDPALHAKKLAKYLRGNATEYPKEEQQAEQQRLALEALAQIDHPQATQILCEAFAGCDIASHPHGILYHKPFPEDSTYDEAYWHASNEIDRAVGILAVLEQKGDPQAISVLSAMLSRVNGLLSRQFKDFLHEQFDTHSQGHANKLIGLQQQLVDVLIALHHPVALVELVYRLDSFDKAFKRIRSYRHRYGTKFPSKMPLPVADILTKVLTDEALQDVVRPLIPLQIINSRPLAFTDALKDKHPYLEALTRAYPNLATVFVRYALGHATRSDKQRIEQIVLVTPKESTRKAATLLLGHMQNQKRLPAHASKPVRSLEKTEQPLPSVPSYDTLVESILSSSTDKQWSVNVRMLAAYSGYLTDPKERDVLLSSLVDAAHKPGYDNEDTWNAVGYCLAFWGDAYLDILQHRDYIANTRLRQGILEALWERRNYPIFRPQDDAPISIPDHVNSFIEPRFNGRNSASYDLLKTAITIGKDGDDVVIRATNVSPLFVKQLNSIFALRGLDATTVPGDTLEISMGRHQLKLRRYRTVDGERQADKTDSQEMPVCVLFLCGMLAEKEF